MPLVMPLDKIPDTGLPRDAGDFPQVGCRELLDTIPHRAYETQQQRQEQRFLGFLESVEDVSGQLLQLS